MKIQNNLSKTTKYIIIIALFLAALSERVFFDMGPNFELVTTTLILSSFYFGKKESFWTVFLIMFFSDLIISNTNIFIFTWSGFLIPALISKSLINNIGSYISPRTKKLFTPTYLTLTGLSANVFFYLWTNFGVWLLSEMYPKTSTGLLMSYINALPFLKYQAISTIIFIPTFYFLTEIALSIASKFLANNSFAISSNTKV